jgi:two-component system chemotaxis response regulator CheY
VTPVTFARRRRLKAPARLAETEAMSSTPSAPGDAHRSDGARRAEILLKRWEGLGLDVKPTPCGRACLLTVPLRPDAFEMPSGALRRFASALLVTVGEDRVKCLRPRALFHLPLLRITDCGTVPEIEARIRGAWAQRLEALGRARRWLEKLGAGVGTPDDAPVLELQIGESRAVLVEAGRLILPGRGLLSGIPLRRAEDRVFITEPSIGSAVDLEIGVTTRLEELGRLHERLAREERLARPPVVDAPRPPPKPAPAASEREPARRILLAGARLATEQALVDALRVRGFEVRVARTAQEALRVFEGASPEIVVSETNLGRFEGVELVPALRGLPGIEEIPVVLVDDRMRPERREAARAAGAAGYLARPFETAKLVAGLEQIVSKPRRRRFTRYGQHLSVSPKGSPGTWVTSDIGRGGMFVWLDREEPVSGVGRYRINLPAVGETVDVDAELLYRRSLAGATRSGAGLRFRGFPAGGEARFIAYLRSLEGTRGAA